MSHSIITVPQSNTEVSVDVPSATNGLQATRILNATTEAVYAAWDLSTAESDLDIEYSVPTKIQQRLMRSDFAESVLGEDNRSKVAAKDVSAQGKYRGEFFHSRYAHLQFY